MHSVIHYSKGTQLFRLYVDRPTFSLHSSTSHFHLQIPPASFNLLSPSPSNFHFDFSAFHSHLFDFFLRFLTNIPPFSFTILPLRSNCHPPLPYHRAFSSERHCSILQFSSNLCPASCKNLRRRFVTDFNRDYPPSQSPSEPN